MSAYTGTDNLEVMAEAKNYNAFLVDLVMKNAGALGSAKAVDFGAGIGTFARMLRARGLDVLCVERDPRQFALIRESGLEAEPALDNLPDESARYIYALNVLEHIEDHEAIVRLMRRKLAPGGRLFVYVPAFQMLFSSMDRKVGHVRRYRKRELVDLVERCGLRVRTARYADSLGFATTLAYKMVGSGSGDIDRRSVIIFDRFIFPLNRIGDAMFGGILGKNVYLVAEK